MSSYAAYGPPSDDDDTDHSSAYSLASLPTEYMIEHGRHFPNRDGLSPFPRGDDVARANELALHNLMFHLCGKQGLWAKNMADLLPEAQITGIDVFPLDGEGRENLGFVLQSHNDQWILDEILQQFGKFDFVYARHLFASSQDYPEFYKQCLE
ncbi:hypothetical protein LTR70_005678 [Exophiala xenobiotica]|uniref:Uncharacterized protein n=1 Tax=Lithohypha guttulata TaxID=1690604 RepID=A0ABR0KDC5_9EURO|nr:hypothetical protein LTR24_004061 [Lithohypha guttulata]KAK5317673.1 hypothetical protein LTR70_005678 [Exophiala xenobiotica]